MSVASGQTMLSDVKTGDEKSREIVHLTPLIGFNTSCTEENR
jgi:hypothetical protein